MTSALALATITVALIAVGATPTHAQSCTALKSQLAAARQSNGGGDRATYRSYAEAADHQARELAKTERLYGRMSCAADPSRQCRSVGMTIRKMRANLAQLERIRDANRPRASHRQIRRLQTAIDHACANQTRTISVRRQTGTRTPASSVSQQIVRQVAPPTAQQSGQEIARQIARTPAWSPPSLSGFASGNYRTMCVRTCDGYFFPISFAASPSSFARDQAVCSALCPAAPTQLFTHRAGDDKGTTNMTALDGTAYTDLEHAFRFQSSGRQPDCACGTARTDLIGILGVTSDGGMPDNTPQATGGSSVPALFPAARPDLAADPETQLDAQQGLTPDKIAAIASSIAIGDVFDIAETHKSVRVVGSRFLPDPAAAIDLQARVPTPFP